jgi:hypothetical protein
LRAQAVGEGAKTRVGFPLLEGQRQLAAPVRIFVHGARQVRLLCHLHRVLELRDHEHGRRAREIFVQGVVECGGGLGQRGGFNAGAGRQQPFARERLQDSRAFVRPRLHL